MQIAERQHLLDNLGHADEEVRRLGVERLSLLPPAVAMPWLVERLADDSWRVRKAAVERLAALPERAGAVQALLEALADGENSGRRSAAAEALVCCGRSAVPQLLAALRSPDVDVRKQVVDVLGLIGDGPATEPVLAAALADADPNVRAAAADSLAALGACDSAPALLASFTDDPEPLVRLAALRALVRLDSPVPLVALAPALADAVLRNAAYAALGQSSDPAAPELVMKGLLAPRASAREAAGEAAVSLVAKAGPADAAAVARRLRELADASPGIVVDVCERLEDAVPAKRLTCIQLLGILRSPGSVLALLRAGADPGLADAASAALLAQEALAPAIEAQWPMLSAAERAFAARVIGAAPPAEVAERLLLCGLSDEAPEVRSAAARALAEVGGAVALRELFDRLAVAEAAPRGEPAEDEAAACGNAVLGIAARGGSAVVDTVLGLVDARLAGGPEGARLAGARLLTRLARPAEAPLLRALLTDASPIVRREVVEGAERLGEGGEALLRVALADESPAVRAAAAAVIARESRPGVDDDLAALAADRDQRVRAATMSALALRAALPESRERAFALLAEGLAGGGIVALAALESLDRIGGRGGAVVALAGLASAEPEIAERAVACVGAHGGPDECAALFPMLAHAAWPVRARAASELGVRRVPHAALHLHARLEGEPDEFVRGALLAALAELER